MNRSTPERRIFLHPAVLVSISFLLVAALAVCLSAGSGGSFGLDAGNVIILGCWALGLSLAMILVARAGRRAQKEVAASRQQAGHFVEELEHEKERRRLAERKAHRILESESFLVKASLGLISRETTDEVVQHLADEALKLFQVRWAIVGAFPADSRELEIMGAARHDSVDDGCDMMQPISGKGLFRGLWQGSLETLVCNDISSHPDSIGFPPGHPVVKKVIVVPLLDRTMKMIGLFALADRLDGRDFGEKDRYLAELLTHYGAAAVARSRAEEDRRRAEQKLQDTTREQVMMMSHASRLAALGEIAAVMAHELNQPLGSIRNYLSGSMDELRRKLEGDASVLSSLEQIPVLVDRAAGIIKRLREFATPNGDTVRSVSISDVIRNAVDLLKPRMERLDIFLEIDVADSLPTVLCDPLSVEQVVLNLLTNACDAMSGCTDRRLSILAGTGADGKTVDVAVADTGPGVPAAIREQIFDAFFTGDETPVERLGLGLSISRSFIREYGGDIVVRNRKGPGTVFVFRLPAVAVDAVVPGRGIEAHESSR